MTDITSLSHYGVKGMKWGQRRAESRLEKRGGSKTKANLGVAGRTVAADIALQIVGAGAMMGVTALSNGNAAVTLGAGLVTDMARLGNLGVGIADIVNISRSDYNDR